MWFSSGAAQSITNIEQLLTKYTIDFYNNIELNNWNGKLKV